MHKQIAPYHTVPQCQNKNQKYPNHPQTHNLPKDPTVYGTVYNTSGGQCCVFSTFCRVTKLLTWLNLCHGIELFLPLHDDVMAWCMHKICISIASLKFKFGRRSWSWLVAKFPDSSSQDCWQLGEHEWLSLTAKGTTLKAKLLSKRHVATLEMVDEMVQECFKISIKSDRESRESRFPIFLAWLKLGKLKALRSLHWLLRGEKENK